MLQRHIDKLYLLAEGLLEREVLDGPEIEAIVNNGNNGGPSRPCGTLSPLRIEPVTAEGRLFGTDGVRGLANHYPVTPEMAFSLGRAGAEHLQGSPPE